MSLSKVVGVGGCECGRGRGRGRTLWACVAVCVACVAVCVACVAVCVACVAVCVACVAVVSHFGNIHCHMCAIEGHIVIYVCLYMSCIYSRHVLNICMV